MADSLLLSMNKLILFDIDGTLLLIDNLADLAFRAMTREVYGLECTFREISYAGKTDPQILEEVLTLHGFDERPSGPATKCLLRSTAHTLITMPTGIPIR